MMSGSSATQFPVNTSSSAALNNDNGSDFFDNYDTAGEAPGLYQPQTQHQQQTPEPPPAVGKVYQPQPLPQDPPGVNPYQMHPQETTNPYPYQSQEQQPGLYQPNLYQPDMYQNQQQPTEMYQPAPQQQDASPYELPKQPEVYQPGPPQSDYNNNASAGYCSSSAPPASEYGAANEYGGGGDGAYGGYSNVAPMQQQQESMQATPSPTMMVPTAAAAVQQQSSAEVPSTSSHYTPTLMTPQFDNNHQQIPRQEQVSDGGWDSFSGQNAAASNGATPPTLMATGEVMQQTHQQNYQSNDMYNNNYGNYQQQDYQQQPTSNVGNSGQSYGRPPCSMVSFGFGGRVCYYSQQLQQLKVTTTKEFIQEESNAAAGGGGGLGLSASDASGYAANNNKQFSHEKLLMESFPGPLAGMRQGQVKSELQKFFAASCGGSNQSANGSERMCTRVLNVLVQQCEKLAKLPNSDLSQQLASVLLPNGTEAAGGVASMGSVNTADHYSDCPLQTAFQQMDPNEAASQMQSLLCQGKSEEALQMALQGQLWGPALTLAHYMGQDKLGDTISAMAGSCLVKGSPLERLMLSISESQVPNRNASFSSLNSLGESNNAKQTKKSSTSGTEQQLPVGQGFGFLNSAGKDNLAPSSAMTSPYGAYNDQQGATLHSWEKSLCILANNRKEWKNVAIKKLGDDLLEKNRDVFGAHLCYVVATFPFEPFTEASKFCLVGWNHLSQVPIADAKSIQLSEVYEWLMTQINSQHVSFALQPYKLLYAFKLLDMGNVVDATKYCQCVLKSFEGKNRLTPELTLCKFKAETLMERLHTYMKLQNIDLPSGNNKVAKIFTSIGGWLDKGITHIMGEDGSGSPHQMQMQVNPGGGPDAANMQHQAAYMQPGNPMQQPGLASMPTASAPTAPADQTSQNGQDAGKAPPSAVQQQQPEKEKAAAKKDSHRRTNSGGGANLFRTFSRNTFGSIGSYLRSSVNDPSYKAASLGKEENTFFFDKELGIWREEGKEPPKAGGALPPPPTAFGDGNSGGSGSNPAAASASDVPLTGATPPPTIPSGSANRAETSESNANNSSNVAPPPLRKTTPGSSRGGVRSRYVDTFSQGNTAAAANTASSSLKSLVPNGNRMGGTSGPAMFVPPSMGLPAAASESDDKAGNGNDGGSLAGSEETKKESSSTISPAPAMFMPPPVALASTDSNNTVDDLAPKPMTPIVPFQDESNSNGNGAATVMDDNGAASSWMSYQTESYEPVPMAYSSFDDDKGSAATATALHSQQPEAEGQSTLPPGQQAGTEKKEEESHPWGLGSAANDDYQDVDL
jgi:hypothetical protein